MSWEVGYTESFNVWWATLSVEEQEEISAKVELLEERGPLLGRPHADTITSSRHSHMKELRGKVKGQLLRVLFAFDPDQMALLLIGGDKTGDPSWYDKNIPLADALFDEHLRELEGRKKDRG